MKYPCHRNHDHEVWCLTEASAPCPVCHELGGFHNDSQHRQSIPAEKLLPKGWQLRAEEQ